MLYRDLLKRAWRNTWREKYLWFFGLFAIFFASPGIYGMFANGLSGNLKENPFPLFKHIIDFFTFRNFTNIGSAMTAEPFSFFLIAVIFIFFVGVFLFLLWLSVVSQASLVNNVALKITKKEHNFGIGLSAGKNNFWKVFALNLFLKIVIYLGFLAISLPFILGFFSANSLSDNLLFTLLFVVFISLGIVFTFFVRFSIAFAVIKNKNLLDSISEGFKLFVKNWMISIEVAFILFFIDFFISVFVLLISLIAATPFVGVGLFLGVYHIYFGLWLLIFIASTIFFGINIFVRMLLTVFQLSVWTDLFTILVSQGAVSKLIRLSMKSLRK